MKIAYCVVAFSSSYLVETIHSIPKGERLLVVDNSMTGWCLSRAWNYAIDRLCRKEGFDVVVICNDDIVLRPETGSQLAQCLADHPELLIASARHTPQDQQDAGPELRDGCDFACFATSARLLDIVGGFDENFVPAHFEDNDMHRRVRLAGYEGKNYAPYFHYLNGTIKSSPDRKRLVESTFPGLHAYYYRKWGGNPLQEYFTIPFNGGEPTPADTNSTYVHRVPYVWM